MKNALLLLLSSIFLASCNVVVTTPAQPELSVAVSGLPGRWHNLEKDGTVSLDEYLDVFPVGDQNHYNVVLYEGGQKGDVFQILLCAAGERDGYWGFVRDEDFSAGFMLFHLLLKGREAEFRWLDAGKVEPLLGSAGLSIELDRNDRFDRFSILKIHAPWKDLLDALNAERKDILAQEMTRFRRGSSTRDQGI